MIRFVLSLSVFTLLSFGGLIARADDTGGLELVQNQLNLILNDLPNLQFAPIAQASQTGYAALDKLLTGDCRNDSNLSSIEVYLRSLQNLAYTQSIDPDAEEQNILNKLDTLVTSSCWSAVILPPQAQKNILNAFVGQQANFFTSPVSLNLTIVATLRNAYANTLVINDDDLDGTRFHYTQIIVTFTDGRTVKFPAGNLTGVSNTSYPLNTKGIIETVKFFGGTTTGEDENGNPTSSMKIYGTPGANIIDSDLGTPDFTYSNGWKYLKWFGDYGPTAQPETINHKTLGFLSIFDVSTPSDIYFYMYPSEGVFYTNATLYPYMYDFNKNAWLYYFTNTAAPQRVFYNFSTSTYQTF